MSSPADLPAGTRKGGKRYVDAYLDSDRPYTDLDFSNCTFSNTGCLSGVFERCDFSYTVFDRSYFRGCTFRDCKFVGARLLHSNFRKIKIEGNTHFDYAYFHQTLIGADTMARCLPGTSNVKRLYCLSLRANYESLADFQAADRFLRLQLEATSEHLQKKQAGAEGYYRNHYKKGGPLRIRYKLHYAAHIASRYFWGHGLSPRNLSFWFGLFYVALVGLVFGNLQKFSMTAEPATILAQLRDSAFFVAITLLGLSYDIKPVTTGAQVLTIGIGAIGYGGLALIIAMLFRRISRR